MMLHIIQLTVLALAVAYVVWTVVMFTRRRYWIGSTLALAGLGIVCGIAYHTHKFLSVTDPYIVDPVSVSAAAPDAPVGCTIHSNTVSVVSSSSIVCVADPGASFHHEVVWLVSRPPAGEIRLHKFELPAFADPDHVHGPDEEVPDRIVAVAAGDNWR